MLTLPVLCGAAKPLDQNSAFNPGLNPQMAIFNIKDYGATGNKAASAQAAIQKAIDACAAAGGGLVYVPHCHSSIPLPGRSILTAVNEW